MTTVVTCQTIEITVSGGGNTHTFTIPAYTRDPESLAGEVISRLVEYLDLSGTGPVSVGDFALRLLAVAAHEPREQEKTVTIDERAASMARHPAGKGR